MTLSATCSAATTALAPAGVSFARRDGCPAASRASFPFTNGRKGPNTSSRRLVPTTRATATPSMPTPAPAPSREMSDFTLNILCKDAPGVLQVRPTPPRRRRILHILHYSSNVGRTRSAGRYLTSFRPRVVSRFPTDGIRPTPLALRVGAENIRDGHCRRVQHRHDRHVAVPRARGARDHHRLPRGRAVRAPGAARRKDATTKRKSQTEKVKQQRRRVVARGGFYRDARHRAPQVARAPA